MSDLTTRNLSNPIGQAFWIMRVTFTIAPILFGLDKFFNILVDWPKYLAPWIPALLNVSPQTFMRGVGVVEIVAGILVGIWPEFFAYVVTLWLWGIIINLLTGPGYYDVALRDFGLSLGALTLGRLAWIHHLEAHRQTETHADRGSAASLPGEKYPLAKSH
ncbi:MAG TPA: hypothetical protein VNL16_19440 [Chloroflexota bacterium]|nr:hypothetical protein [Chloroflexota bacterium]